MKEEWRSVKECGEQCATMAGIGLMLKLCADN